MAPEAGKRAKWGWAVPIAAVFLALSYWAFTPRRAPHQTNPSVWDVLVDNRWVVGGIRALGLAVSIYALLSIYDTVWRGAWAERIGFLTLGKVKNTVQGAVDNSEQLKRELQDAKGEIERLKADLRKSAARMRTMRSALNEAQTRRRWRRRNIITLGPLETTEGGTDDGY